MTTPIRFGGAIVIDDDIVIMLDSNVANNDSDIENYGGPVISYDDTVATYDGALITYGDTIATYDGIVIIDDA